MSVWQAWYRERWQVGKGILCAIIIYPVNWKKNYQNAKLNMRVMKQSRILW